MNYFHISHHFTLRTPEDGFAFSLFVLLVLPLSLSLLFPRLPPLISQYILNVLGTTQASARSTGMWRKTNSKGVDVMVAMMGIVGFLFWIMLSIFSATWAIVIQNLSPEYFELLKWSCAKNFLRSLGILFQLYIFMKSDPYIGCRNNMRKRKLIYFILPALTLSLLAVFIMAVIDTHSEVIELLIDNSKINHVLMVLLKAGEPLYLGFCLHLFLHFLIINNNMRKEKELLRNEGRETVRPTKSNPRGNVTSKHKLHDTLIDYIVHAQVNQKPSKNDPLLEPLLDPNGEGVHGIPWFVFYITFQKYILRM